MTAEQLLALLAHVARQEQLLQAYERLIGEQNEKIQGLTVDQKNPKDEG